MPYYIYILQSLKDKKYYIGSCKNVKARLEFHNKGLQRSTRNRIPFILVYWEELPDKPLALIREKQIKSFKGGNAFKKLLQGGGPPAKCGTGSNSVDPTLPAEALRRRAFFMGHVVQPKIPCPTDNRKMNQDNWANPL